jgi:hypothetical protein
LSTQFVRVAQTLKMEPRNVRVKVDAKYFREGSVLAGTADAMCDSLVTELSFDCDDSPERIAKLISMAEATCYTLGALRKAVPCELKPTVNQAPFEV